VSEQTQQQAGFKIGGTFYAAPSSFRVGDAILIRELTGMPFPDFAEALDDDERKKDPIILAGLIGVAIWQSKPTLRRDKVVKYVEQIDFESLDFQGDEAEVTDEVVPPVEVGDEPS
jgi:hypothetical protein